MSQIQERSQQLLENCGSFSLALEKEERERGGEEKGEKRREKEKRKRKDYEVMGRAPVAF